MVIDYTISLNRNSKKRKAAARTDPEGYGNEQLPSSARSEDA